LHQISAKKEQKQREWEIKLGETAIRSVQPVKFLGLRIATNLNWEKQIVNLQIMREPIKNSKLYKEYLVVGGRPGVPTKAILGFNSIENGIQCLLTPRTESESYITTDGQSASLSWNKTPVWGL
jgi:hypothetical protein